MAIERDPSQSIKFHQILDGTGYMIYLTNMIFC